MTDPLDRRRYKVRDRRSDGKFFYDTNWTDAVQIAPDWFKTKEEAVAAWLNANQEVQDGVVGGADGPKRRGRPPTAEVETGVVEG